MCKFEREGDLGREEYVNGERKLRRKGMIDLGERVGEAGVCEWG